jgi:hypothetical protein
MLGSVFTHPHRGDTIITDLLTATTDLLTAAVGVELQCECNLCSIIRIGKDLIPEQTAETMRNRTDWGELLQPVSLPENIEQPPTGKEVKLLHKPKW